MKKSALALLILLATALLPISAQAAPGDQPAWSVSGFLHDLWSLVLDGTESLWQQGQAAIDPVVQDGGSRVDPEGNQVTQDGGPTIDPIGQDGGELESVEANGADD